MCIYIISRTEDDSIFIVIGLGFGNLLLEQKSPLQHKSMVKIIVLIELTVSLWFYGDIFVLGISGYDVDIIL